MYQSLLTEIYSKETSDYNLSISELSNYLETITQEDLLDIILHIGTIPEMIQPSSTLEKIYTKVSEIILAKAFNQLGFQSQVIHTRSNTGDVLITSPLNYTVMVDCKCFRATRTAKNQKDFKIASLSQWKKENTYALLVMPEHQITENHQIYKQSTQYNVQIIYWETLAMLLYLQISEPQKDLHELFIPKQGMITTEQLLELIQVPLDINYLSYMDTLAIQRYDFEKEQLLSSVSQISELSKEDLVRLLLKELKIDKKLDILEREKNKRL